MKLSAKAAKVDKLGNTLKQFISIFRVDTKFLSIDFPPVLFFVARSKSEST